MLAAQQQGRLSFEGGRGWGVGGGTEQQVAEVISLPYVGTSANIYIDICNTCVQLIYVIDC